MPTPHHFIQTPVARQPRAKTPTVKEAAAGLLNVYLEIYANIPNFAIARDPVFAGHLAGVSTGEVTSGNGPLLEMAQQIKEKLIELEHYRPLIDRTIKNPKFVAAAHAAGAVCEAASAPAADLRARFNAALEVAVSKGIFSPQALIPIKKSGHTK